MVLKSGNKTRWAVIGYGSWATALVKIILENDRDMLWYIRDREVIKHIETHGWNPRYLKNVRFTDPKPQMSDDLNHVVANADVLVLATPSAFLKITLENLTVPLHDKFIISAIKGIIPEQYITVAEYMNQQYEVPFEDIGILTGPCHAEEVALERLSYLTLACKDVHNAQMLGDKLSTDYIKVNCSTDIYGTEYAAVIKNIYAVATGIASGLGYGDNFIAVLISNADMEMNRFLESTYPFQRNTSASAYLGDLLVTAYSQFSRNRALGVMVGKGHSARSAQTEMGMIAEGYYAAECIMKIINRHNLSMPIAETVYKILYQNAAPGMEMEKLSDNLV